MKPQIRSDSFFFFQAEDGIRDKLVTGVQTCALPILGLVFLHTAFSPPLFLLSFWEVLAPHLLAKRMNFGFIIRSEERRVGKECRSRRSPYDRRKKISTGV